MYSNASFGPGDNILFERGRSFNGQFAPRANGADGNLVTISAFGEGARPIINNNGVVHAHPTRAGATTSAGILLFNSEYVEVSGLEITNNNGTVQEIQSHGIHVLGEDLGRSLNTFIIRDNVIRDVNPGIGGDNRGGIHFNGNSPQSSNGTSFNDVQIFDNRIERVGGIGISTAIARVNIEDGDSVPRDQVRENAILGLHIAHNFISETGRNAIRARDSDGAVVEYNTAAFSSRFQTGNSLFTFNARDTLIQYNEVYGNTGDSDDTDRGAVTSGFNTVGTTIQYNYFHGNHWAVSIQRRNNNDLTIRNNISVNNEFGAYHFGFPNNSELFDANVYNNTHFFNAELDPELIGPQLDRVPLATEFTNNVFVADGSGTAGTNADVDIQDDVFYDNNIFSNITPPTSGTNNIEADPQLVSPGAEPFNIDLVNGRDVLIGYALASNSPFTSGAVDFADNGGFDFFGRPLSPDSTGFGAGSAFDFTGPAATVLPATPFLAASDSNVLAATPAQGNFGDDASVSLSQTFQVDADFDLKTILLGYEYDPNANPEDIVVNLEIFEVDDVGAETLTPSTTRLVLTALSLPELIDSDTGAIVLDEAISLEETTGTAGYALRISNGGVPGFEWLRTGSTAADVFALGQAYQNNAELFSGERDFVLALSSLNLISPINGDFNDDGIVDAADYVLLRDQAGATLGSDLAEFQANFGAQTSGSSTVSVGDAVPEPTTLALLALGTTGLLTRRRS